MSYIDEEKKRAQEEMYMAQNPEKNRETVLATNTSSSYNRTKDPSYYGSYEGSSTGFSSGSNYLTKPKDQGSILGRTPSVGETYYAKSNESYVPFANSTPSKTDTSPMYKEEEPQLNLNLPSIQERDFGKGALGDEREREVYNFDILDQAAKKGYLKDTRTDDDFFRIGFLGLEDTPKYAFTEKADDNVKNQLFNLLDYKTPQARIDAFKEIQDRSKFSRARETNNELRTDTLPGMEKPIRQGFIKPAGEMPGARLLNTSKPASAISGKFKTQGEGEHAIADFNKTLTTAQNALEGTEKSKIKPSNPDVTEFGEDSETYKILQDISKRWYATSDPAEKDRLHGVAEDVRMYHRQGTPIVDRHDAIMNLLHENKKKAQAYQKTMTEGIPGFLYRMSDGNYMLDSSAYLIGMVNEGEWDYKYNKDWQVKYDYFDGVDMDTPKSNYRNWKPWMYFDGYLISADKLGNMNMAYVGKNMGLAEWVYKNVTTTDKDDEFWVQYGIDLANSGR